MERLGQTGYGFFLNFYALLVLAMCGLTGCGQRNSDISGREGYTFTDDLGRQVTVASHERVAVLLGSYADMWMLAGGEVCAAPEDAFVDFDLALSGETVNLGETKRLSLELLFSAEPDLVLASTNTAQHLE